MIVIRDWFEESREGKAFGILTVAQNFLWVITSVNIGVFQDQLGMGWRGVYWYSGGLSLLIAILTLIFLPGSPSEALKPPRRSGTREREEEREEEVEEATEIVNCACQKLREVKSAEKMTPKNAFKYFATSWHFWLMFISLCCYTYVFELTEWTSVYIYDVLPDLSYGKGNILGASWAIGGTFAALFYGFLYDVLSWRSNSIFLVGFSILLTGICTAMSLTVTYSWPLMLFYQLSFGALLVNPFYLPSSFYATRFGGDKYCGTLSGIFDGSGYALSMLMDASAGPLSDRWGWGSVMLLITLFCLIATITLAMFQYVAAPHKEEFDTKFVVN